MLSMNSSPVGISTSITAPRPQSPGRAHDGRGPVVIARLGILEIGESRAALEQAETDRTVIEKGRGFDPRGVRDRPPQPFARAVLDHQQIAVMHPRAEIVADRGPQRPLEIHRGQRRHADIGDLAPGQERHGDVGHGVAPGRRVMSRCPASDGLSITASIRTRARRRMQAQMGEARKLLGRGSAGAQRDGAGGQAVDHRLPDGAEIARALQDQHLVHAVRRVQRVAQPQAREPRAGGGVGDVVEIAVVEVEEVGREGDLFRPVAVSRSMRTGSGKNRPGGSRSTAKSGPCGSIAERPGIGPDAAIGVVAQPGEGRRQGRRAASKGARRRAPLQKRRRGSAPARAAGAPPPRARP
jgi:hypothetical protein